MKTRVSRIALLAATGAMLVGLPMCSSNSSNGTSNGSNAPVDPSPAGGSHEVPTPEETAARDALANTPLGYVVSRAARGAARLILASPDTTPAALDVDAATAARVHLSRHAELLGVSEAAIRDITQIDVQKLPGGASIVQFAQRVNGIEIFRARASVVLDGSKNVVSIGATLTSQAAATHAASAMAFSKSPEAVLAQAYSGHFGFSVPAASVKDVGARSKDLHAYSVRVPGGAPAVLDASAKRVLFPDGDQLIPAYYVEMTAQADGENDAHAYVISADGARVLYHASLTASDVFKYRVFADPNGPHNIPLDGPLVDLTPNNGGPDKAVQPFGAPPILVSMEGFNTNPDGQVDPWLPSNAAHSFGNNVHAYTDRDDQHDGKGTGDGFEPGMDIEADPTSDHTFDRTFNVNTNPNASVDQEKAAITNLFYVTNWLHDYWYDSGFNEAAGVAQLSNFGRGGVEGDPLHAEAQDGADFGQINNANMSTPQDGVSPRMQMFVWTGLPNRTFEITPSGKFTDPLGVATFGPTTFDVTGTAVLVNDGTSSATDGCNKPVNVSGKLAVVDRGGVCTLLQKTQNAQAGGATGVILLNNVPGHRTVNAGGQSDPNVTIPTLGLSFEDGVTLKTAIGAGPVTAHIRRGVEIIRDGDIDNTVISHEWGHYLHHRLVQCGSQSCGGMSEGWADFDALMMVIRESDLNNDLFGQSFALAQYAAAGIIPSAAYFGIRRTPYTTDFGKNPFTFKNVRHSQPLPTGAPLNPASPDPAEVHNVGEIWAEMLFEGYVNLLHGGILQNRSFDDSKRALATYIVAGMKATPVEPTFNEQRDALLAVVRATGNMNDFSALAHGFAKRGLGAAAVSPPVSSNTLDEAVEDFGIHGALNFVDGKIDDSVHSCDHDGILDAGEKGKLTIRFRNLGWEAIGASAVSVSTTDPSITFDNDGLAAIDSVDTFGIATATIGIAADNVPISRTELPIMIQTHNDKAVPITGHALFDTLYNYDDVPNSSRIDTVESSHPVWQMAHGGANLHAWSRQGDASNHFWHGDDIGTTGDEQLVSPNLIVGTGDFKIGFKHRFQFETQPASGTTPAAFFDGGVIELSTDGGATWADVSTFADPGYPQTLVAGGTNVLNGRKAFAGMSDGYPNFVNVAIDLHKQLQGKTVKLRFRLGTDESGGAAGWDIDNIAISGITNLPFPSIVDKRTRCSAPSTTAAR